MYIDGKIGLPRIMFGGYGTLRFWQELEAQVSASFFQHADLHSTMASYDEQKSFDPYEFQEGRLDRGLLILCDHASNAVPPGYGDLGLPKEQFERHIGYDIGARALTLQLAERLGVPAVLSTFSRLFIDPNRGEDDPTIIMRLSDGAVVPGNAQFDHAERQRRIEHFHRPYHEKISSTLDAMLNVAAPPVVISIHSFTPVWRGVPRRGMARCFGTLMIAPSCLSLKASRLSRPGCG